ncbi:beta and beta-prime subunits of DNA dependent RNA-polymerase [Viridothelium virens]|uniref:DNA-directed RNA polymerase subunit n=1 Tax=Viridothelium virens TaxID=1048519 RepID=A0A6A6H963_VIRVR|nr:beta and beta-prime subunits of DNA dependent RNA-polymerase [Viridothelium virens]
MATKEQVRHEVPKRIKELRFGVLSKQEIVKQSVLEVNDRNIYDLAAVGSERHLTKNGPNDARMGISARRDALCETCGGNLNQCNGHFGRVQLALPVYHVGYFGNIVEILQDVCKACSWVLLPEDARRNYLRQLRRPNLDSLQRKMILRRVTTECKKSKACPYCGTVNGVIRKVPQHALKIVHDKFRAYTASQAKSKEPPPSKLEFDKSFEEARAGNSELDRHMKKAVDDLNPLKVLNIFRRIPANDCELLGMDPVDGRPEMFIWQYVPAPPVCIRPSVQQDTASTEDDITNKLGDILQTNNIIKIGLKKGQPIQTIMEQWDFMQLQLATYIDGSISPIQQGSFAKSSRGFNQRLKGKQGRFRQNLSGKRVDFSGRTVISPDPNLSIDEVGIPRRVAIKLSYPEKVTRHNIEKLRVCIRRGGKRHPGAKYIQKKDGQQRMLGILSKLGGYNMLERYANELEVGDVVERHIDDGDIVLFNRQPSLHKLSILAHKVKVRPWRTFRLNECVCTPYNADFDGDEMNLHVPQTEEARAEAEELMGVKYNLATPKNGAPIIAAIQDFITTAYLSTNRDRFFDRRSFCQICSYMFDGDSFFDPDSRQRLSIEIPAPAIMKPERLWTGKQIWNVLMRPNRKSKVLVNMEAPCKQYKAVKDISPDMNEDDAYLVIRNSEVMCGVMDKATIGDGKKDSVFYVLLRDFGPDYAVQAMNRLAKLSARWLTDRGFSIGIDDVWPTTQLSKRKEGLMQEAEVKCDKLLSEFRASKLARDAGCDIDTTLENKISGILSAVRESAGAQCLEELDRRNAPLIMAKCGAKGSNINVAQMVAAVGQQIISGRRVMDGFEDRTLPHFPKGSKRPPAKGFVANSFFSGLTPPEFIFHAMSGREGLVDTAVKTAETGYMSRRLMKTLEDLSAQYDHTVRNSSAGIVQFQYGDDKLDPVDMEGKAKPVNFERTFMHAIASTWSNTHPGLLPLEVKQQITAGLDTEKAKLKRMSFRGASLEYYDQDEFNTDQFESARGFLDEIGTFVEMKADRLARLRRAVGLDSGTHASQNHAEDDAPMRHIANSVAKISKEALAEFLRLCLTKYEKSKVQPGHAVGAVGAQSIGEPGTQMTLKTFHFAGVAGMSITQGVPRIKEIINASKTISTPVITCVLDNNKEERAARFAKAKIEKTYLRDIMSYIEEVWQPEGGYIQLRIDTDLIQRLGLDVNLRDIQRAIVRTRGLKMDVKYFDMRWRTNTLRLFLPGDVDTKSRSRPAKREPEEEFIKMQNLLRIIPNIVIRGYPEASRAIIRKDDKPNKEGYEEISLLVEGYGLKACMTTEGVNGRRSRTNSVKEVQAVLGIEAARKTIIDEIGSVMGSMDIDPRHMQLLADVMTYKGDVLGITRFGLAKMGKSVFHQASFEKTPDHLFDAAFHNARDRIEGVSECIIMGQTMGVGTGAMNVVRELKLEEDDFKRRGLLFEESFKAHA